VDAGELGDPVKKPAGPDRESHLSASGAALICSAACSAVAALIWAGRVTTGGAQA